MHFILFEMESDIFDVDLGLYYDCELFYAELKKKPKLNTTDIRNLVLQQIKDSKCMICDKVICECVEDIDDSV